jgi:hypothetical protein
MTADAIYSLYRRFMHECRILKDNERDLKRLAPAYLSYRELLERQQRTRSTIIKIFGVLGVHAPEVTQETKRLISPIKDVHSETVREGLRLWEVLQLFLSATEGKATIAQFQDFLFELGWTVPTPQAIDSAIRSHPELFEESSDGKRRFLVLRSGV